MAYMPPSLREELIVFNVHFDCPAVAYTVHGACIACRGANVEIWLRGLHSTRPSLSVFLKLCGGFDLPEYAH